MTERGIQEAVARADVIICAVLRRLPLVAALTLALLLAVLAARGKPPPDAHDITSEGPEGDYTDEWYRW